MPTKLLRAFFSFNSNCVLGELPFLFPPSDVVPAAAVAASYLLGPKMGEPINGGDEDAISMAKGDDAGNPVHPLALSSMNKLISRIPRLASLPRFCGVLARSSTSTAGRVTTTLIAV
jgi:hypothetical protein